MTWDKLLNLSGLADSSVKWDKGHLPHRAAVTIEDIRIQGKAWHSLACGQRSTKTLSLLSHPPNVTSKRNQRGGQRLQPQSLWVPTRDQMPVTSTSGRWEEISMAPRAFSEAISLSSQHQPSRGNVTPTSQGMAAEAQRGRGPYPGHTASSHRMNIQTSRTSGQPRVSPRLHRASEVL